LPQAAPQQIPQPIPQPYTPVQTPVYAGQVPEEYEEQEPPKKKFPVWIIIIIALVLICCLCIGAFVLLDQFNVITRDMWCEYLGPVFNMISAGSCP